MKTLLFFIMIAINMMASFAQPSQPMTINVNLYVIGEDGGPGEHLFGGVRADYFTNYCNCIDNNDALKMGGEWATEIAISSNNKWLSIERRDTVAFSDTMRLVINNRRNINMMAEIWVTNAYPANVGILMMDAVTNGVIGIPIDGTRYKYYFTAVPGNSQYADTRLKLALTNPPGRMVKTEFDVYPNPIHPVGLLNISGNVKSLYLFNMSGSKIASISISNHTGQMPAVTPGMYILYDPTTNQRKRIIVF